MPNVHANDTYTALEIAPEATYGTDPGAPYKRVPFLGETLAFQRKAVEQTKEIKAFGGQASGSYGSGEISGVIRTLGYYNSPWLHLLMCHAMGGMEEYNANLMAEGTSNTGANTHNYLPQSFKCFTAGSVGGRPIGLTARAWKAGPNNTAGEIEVLTGCIVNSWEFTHRYNAYPEMAFGIVGKETTRLSAIGLTPTALVTSPVQYPIKPNGIGINSAGILCPSLFQAGAAVPAFQISEWSVKLETPVQFPDRFLNDMDGDYEPAIVGNRKVTGRIGYRMNQTSMANGKPPYEFISGTLGSKIRARYASGLAAGTPITPAVGDAGVFPYVFDVALGALQWTEGPSSINGAGIIEGTVNFQAYEFTYGASAGYAHASANRKGPIYVSFSVDEADDSDAKFTATAAGGNDLDSTLR